jgi:hypothetical protein
VVRTGRPLTLPEPWRTLAAKAGGAKELAALMGVSYTSLRGWAVGTQEMSGSAKILFAQVKKRLDRLPVPGEAKESPKGGVD